MFADDMDDTTSLKEAEEKVETTLNTSNGLDFSDVPYDV
jgi:hypothetical protein